MSEEETSLDRFVKELFRHAATKEADRETLVKELFRIMLVGGISMTCSPFTEAYAGG